MGDTHNAPRPHARTVPLPKGARDGWARVLCLRRAAGPRSLQLGAELDAITAERARLDVRLALAPLDAALDALRGRLAPPPGSPKLPPDGVPACLTAHAGDALPSPADVELVAER